MKRPNASSTAGPFNIHGRTGDHCPQSGWWFTFHDNSSTNPGPSARFISEGSMMPAMGGFPCRWVLLPQHKQIAASTQGADEVVSCNQVSRLSRITQKGSAR